MGVRAVMAVPLRRNDDVIGLIYVDSRMATGLFQEEDLRVLAVLANIAAIQIENARLLAGHREKIQIEQELQAAAAVQRRLLPPEAPSVPGYAIDAVNVPCYEVGGDFYDYVRLDDDRQGIVIADVAGKRLQAAMLMMGLQATFRAHVALGPAPDDLLAKLNEAMIRNAPRNRFVTLSYVELDHFRHELRWVNAGHIPAPVIVRAGGGAESLQPGNVPLGVLEEASYPIGSARLDPGDFLFMCSDGVNETVGPDGHQFGLERLAELLESLAGRPPEEVRHTVEERLEQHSSGTRQPDDLTIIVVQRVA
jgi:serine phosphatase RsbU (regulator of sigma subunit)